MRLTDQTHIAEVARAAKGTHVRQAALKRLTDPATLSDIAANDTDEKVRRVAATRLRLCAAEALPDQTLAQATYADIAKDDQSEWAHLEAVTRLADQALLADVAKSATSVWVVFHAAGKLADRALARAAYVRVVVEGCRHADEPLCLRRYAIRTFSDPVGLETILGPGLDPDARRAARKRLKELTALDDLAPVLIEPTPKSKV
jgi:hypothetical protein